MEDKKILTIIKEDGTEEKVELLISFVFDSDQKEYVVYTKNETDENGNVTLYCSGLDRSGEMPQMYGIESDEEWARIKDVLLVAEHLQNTVVLVNNVKVIKC